MLAQNQGTSDLRFRRWPTRHRVPQLTPMIRANSTNHASCARDVPGPRTGALAARTVRKCTSSLRLPLGPQPLQGQAASGLVLCVFSCPLEVRVQVVRQVGDFGVAEATVELTTFCRVMIRTVDKSKCFLVLMGVEAQLPAPGKHREINASLWKLHLRVGFRSCAILHHLVYLGDDLFNRSVLG